MSEDNPRDKPETPSDGAGVGLAAGTRIGKYEIIEAIGAGGQSVVYKGRDTQLDRIVAIKQISAHLGADDRFVKRFRAEAKILAQLGGERSNIVAVYDLIEHELGLFIAMEHVEGHTLAEVLAYQDLALPVDVTIDILGNIANGLRVAHAAGVVHRDIKPGNVIVTRSHMAKITDFGVAAQAGQDDSLSLGTTKYMAPEVFSGVAVDQRVDIYSLGFLAYEMLTGRQFFRKVFRDVLRDKRSENLRWMKWHSDPDLAPPNLADINPQVSRALGDCVARMMAKDPQRRYESVDQVIADLTAITEAPEQPEPGEQVLAETVELKSMAAAAEAYDDLPTTTAPRKPMSTRAKITIAGVVVAALVVLGVVLATVVGGRQRELIAKADAAYQQAGETYQRARALYDKEGDLTGAIKGFAEAQKQFEQYTERFGNLPRGTGRSRARALLSEAYQAMLRGDIAGAEDLLVEAKRLEAVSDTVIERFSRDLTARHSAVQTLDQMEQAIEAGDFLAAESAGARFARLDGPPLDQDRRARRLTQRLREAKSAAEIQRALAAGDAAKANAETAAAADRAEKFEDAISHLGMAAEHYQRAEDLAPEDPVVRRRLAALREAREFVNARAVYVRTLTDKKPLDEQVRALKAVVAARPPTEALRDELATARAELGYQRAIKLIESGRRSDLRAAREALVEAVGHKRLPKAVAALADVEKLIEHGDLVAQADRATRNGEFAEAVSLLEKAEAVRHDETTAAMLSDARITLHMAAGDAARKARQWAEALTHYEKARQVRLDDEDLSNQVDRRADLVGREREYYDLLEQARKLLAEANYRQAVNRLSKAERLAASEDVDIPADEAARQKKLARYQWEVAKGKAAAADGNLRGALGFFRIAQNLINTAEVRRLISEVQAKVD